MGCLGPVLGLSWGCLGLSWACLGLSWGCLGPALGCLGPVLACLGVVLGNPWEQEPQKRPKSRSRSRKWPPKWSPKSDFLGTFLVFVFRPCSGLVFDRFLGRLGPQKQRFRLGGPSKTVFSQSYVQERKRDQKVQKRAPEMISKIVKKCVKKGNQN